MSKLAAEDAINPITTDLPKVEVAPERSKDLLMLESLIEITKKNLDNQKNLRGLILEYLDIYDKYVENMDNKQLSFRMIKKAKEVLDLIKETHLIHSFDQDFLSELTYFSNIASKWED